MPSAKLAMAAVVRWLLRRTSFVFEEAAIADYAFICLKLSNGRTKDVLNLLPDLAERVEEPLLIAA